MEITSTKISGKFYLRLRLRGETLHEQACDYDQVDWFLEKYHALYKLWKEQQSKAVVNRWATFQWVCENMDFPMETGAHAAIFSMVNSDVYS